MKAGIFSVDWSDIRNFVSKRGASVQYVETPTSYLILVSDDVFSLETIIAKSSPASEDQLEFEGTYKQYANDSFRSGHYSSPVNIRQTTRTASDSTVFSITNPAESGKTMYIEHVNLMITFDSGSTLIGSLLRYSIQTFGAAAPSGGATQSAAKLDSNNPNSLGPEIRFSDTGLSTDGVSFGNTIVVLGCPSSNGAMSRYVRSKSDYVIKIRPGEGLCVRLAAEAAAGQGITGEIVWSER